MTIVSDIPLWAALLISIMCIMGALLTLVGNLGALPQRRGHFNPNILS